MPIERTNKSLSERVEITFHHRPNRMRQLRWRWSLAALGVTILVPLAAALVGDNRLYQAGPVSEAHQLIANDCKQCHDGSWQPLARLMSFDDRRVSTSDHACTVCHAGPIHHTNQREPSARCAECHREHRDHSILARVDDAACVHCHRDLQTNEGPSKSFATIIDDFSGHPEFAVKRAPGDSPVPGPNHKIRNVAKESNGNWEDPTPLRFNHAKHLPAAGLLRLDGTRKNPSCEECHQVDRDSGYMRPINHDFDCASCHENTRHFGPTSEPTKAIDERKTIVAHGSVAQVHAKLVEFYSNDVKAPPAASPPPDVVPREMPGREPKLKEKRWNWVQDRVTAAEERLFDTQLNGCRYCHTAVSKTNDDWKVEPPRIPQRWLKHGKFRHDRHTLVTCTECHVGAEGSVATSNVLLPGVDTCRNCHSASSPPGKQGVARTDCVECHVYHDHSGEQFDGPLSLELKAVKSEHKRRAPSKGGDDK